MRGIVREPVGHADLFDIAGGDCRGQRHTASQGLGQHHNVGHHPVMLEAIGAAEATRPVWERIGHRYAYGAGTECAPGSKGP